MRPATRLVRLGATDSLIPAVVQGCGTNAPLSDAEARGWCEVIRYGLDFGLMALDTAETYGGGTSEQMVGRAVHGMRERFFIATKVSPQNLAYRDVLRAADGSLRRLGTDYIDLYQIHWPNPRIPVEETLSAMQELVRRGKVRFCGVSNFSAGSIAHARTHGIEIVSNQVEYNVVDRSAEHELLDFCGRNDVTMLAYSPLARLRVAAHADKLSRLQDIAARHACTPEQVLLAWTMRHRHIAAVVKTQRKENLRRNLQAMAIELSQQDMAEIDSLFPDDVRLLEPKRIRVAQVASENRRFYESLEEALANACQYSPSPAELAEAVRKGETLKPIKVVAKDKAGKREFVLVEGQVRYWAHVIARGIEVPIRGYVHEEDGL